MQPQPQRSDDPTSDPFAQLDNISAERGSPLGDAKTREEEEDLETQRKRAELRGYQQDTEERKKYAGRFFVLACSWVTAITVILLVQGFGSWLKFGLTEPTLLAAIGSTTVNILGILYVVANYLFPKK